MLKGNEIRQLYLDYFKNKHQHTIVRSSDLGKHHRKGNVNAR